MTEYTRVRRILFPAEGKKVDEAKKMLPGSSSAFFFSGQAP
jgi:hypothetical protein